eukprot:UN20547
MTRSYINIVLELGTSWEIPKSSYGERPPNFLEIFDTCEWLCEVAQLILAFLDPNPTEPKFKFWVDQKPEDDVAINGGLVS